MRRHLHTGRDEERVDVMTFESEASMWVAMLRLDRRSKHAH